MTPHLGTTLLHNNSPSGRSSRHKQLRIIQWILSVTRPGALRHPCEVCDGRQDSLRRQERDKHVFSRIGGSCGAGALTEV